MAKASCGKVVAAAWEEYMSKQERKNWVRKHQREGYSIEITERFDDDPQPEWICNESCQCFSR